MEQVNYRLVTDYNRTFGTKLDPEQKYSISTLVAMRKKLIDRDVYKYKPRHKQDWVNTMYGKPTFTR